MKKIIAMMLVLMLVLCSAAVAEVRSAEYLAEYYNINFEDTITVDAFNDALTYLGASPIEAETMTVADAVVGAVRVADMEQLALAYTNPDAGSKVADTLGDITVDEAIAPYIACALDLGLITADTDLTAELDAATAADMLYAAAEMSGWARHYIGRISDDNIIEAVRAAINSFVIFDDELLNQVGMEILMQGATTGYNLKYAPYNANFMPEYTLKYGHSDLTHAAQLLALLKSEGIDGYIQIEPKVSVYEYMLDWGEPGAPTPTYAVRQVTEDHYYTYAVEYDMMIEFDTVEDREAFHGIIETFAKKYSDSYDADHNLVEPLIAGAWWQPLYSSTTEMENEEFGILINNVIINGDYTIQSFCVPENQDAVAAVVAEVAPELLVSNETIYVNPAFMRYITGTSAE